MQIKGFEKPLLKGYCQQFHVIRMVKANFSEKETIVNILAQSFDDNKSVNYIIKQDGKRRERIRKLMAYAFDVCNAFGAAYLTEDKKACALIVFPDKKKTTLKSMLWDIRLVANCVGLEGVSKTMSREKKIKTLQPDESLYYLWFIGVNPEEQNKGIGSLLLNEIIRDAEQKNRTLCLETSTQKNIPWYQKFGFNIYNELDLGYKLYFLKI
ncbi:MAG: GNAT family N-acetyltransferase [Flavisolibacter sp.]|nr:GNAT family N-acetyltransferase [Flavisolibacter sp.]